MHRDGRKGDPLFKPTFLLLTLSSPVIPLPPEASPPYSDPIRHLQTYPARILQGSLLSGKSTHLEYAWLSSIPQARAYYVHRDQSQHAQPEILISIRVANNKTPCSLHGPTSLGQR